MHREPDVGPDPGSPGLRPGPKAGAKPLRHPGFQRQFIFYPNSSLKWQNEISLESPAVGRLAGLVGGACES